jgi:replication factor A1
MLTLEETIQLILKNSPEYERKDIMKMIEEKRQELGPEVVNEESAAMIVARELGIDLQQVSARARMKIEDITESTRSVALTAKVVGVSGVRTFSRSDGGEGKVASITIADSTGKMRVALWDDRTKAVSEDYVSVGSIIQIRNAYVKKGLRNSLELNLGRMGNLKVLDEYELDDLDIEIPKDETTSISNLEENMYDVSIKFQVQRAFPLSTFTRKSDGSEGKVLSVIGADETGSTRVTFWNGHAEQMKDAEEGEVIRLSGAYTRAGRYGDVEVHSGRSAIIERDVEEDIDAVEVQGLGVSSEPLGRKNIEDLTVEMRDVDIEGKVIRIFPPNEFERDGGKGRVQNIIVADDTGTTRMTFWNEDVEEIADLKEEDVVRVRHGYVREGFRGGVEFHAGRRSEIELNPSDSTLQELDVSEVSARPTTRANRIMIGDIDESMVQKNVEIYGNIMKIFDSRPVYPACPDCRKKVEETEEGFSCDVHGDIENVEYRTLFKVVLDDGTGSITVTLFGEAGEQLLDMSADEAQKLIEKTGNMTEPIDLARPKIQGRDVVVQGRVSMFRKSLDITASSLEFGNPIDEIARQKDEIEKLIS